jgi:monoamine oxidase
MNFSRRRFLGAVSAFSLVPSAARTARPSDLDVAIIGGGAAGTYTAWRLALERPDLRVRLFEASERIGGRLFSVAFPQAPHLVTELGGMRFLDAHRHVSGLVAHLGLPIHNFPIDRDANRVLLRGRNFSQRDIRAGRARFPYRIPDADLKPGAEYFDRAIARVLPNAAQMTAADWGGLSLQEQVAQGLEQSRPAAAGNERGGAEIQRRHFRLRRLDRRRNGTRRARLPFYP